MLFVSAREGSSKCAHCRGPIAASTPWVSAMLRYAIIVTAACVIGVVFETLSKVGWWSRLKG